MKVSLPAYGTRQEKWAERYSVSSCLRMEDIDNSLSLFRWGMGWSWWHTWCLSHLLCMSTMLLYPLPNQPQIHFYHRVLTTWQIITVQGDKHVMEECTQDRGERATSASTRSSGIMAAIFCYVKNHSAYVISFDPYANSVRKWLVLSCLSK